MKLCRKWIWSPWYNINRDIPMSLRDCRHLGPNEPYKKIYSTVTGQIEPTSHEIDWTTFFWTRKR